jgi:hypothetical protein
MLYKFTKGQEPQEFNINNCIEFNESCGNNAEKDEKNIKDIRLTEIDTTFFKIAEKDNFPKYPNLGTSEPIKANWHPWQPWQPSPRPPIGENFNNSIDNISVETGSMEKSPMMPKMPNITAKDANSDLEKLEKEQQTDRELQYWESPECAGIVTKITKEEVFEFLKQNEGISTAEALEKMGLGFFKHLESLLIENKVRRDNHKIYVENGIQ